MQTYETRRLNNIAIMNTLLSAYDWKSNQLFFYPSICPGKYQDVSLNQQDDEISHEETIQSPRAWHKLFLTILNLKCIRNKPSCLFATTRQIIVNLYLMARVRSDSGGSCIACIHRYTHSHRVGCRTLQNRKKLLAQSHALEQVQWIWCRAYDQSLYQGTLDVGTADQKSGWEWHSTHSSRHRYWRFRSTRWGSDARC